MFYGIQVVSDPDVLVGFSVVTVVFKIIQPPLRFPYDLYSKH